MINDLDYIALQDLKLSLHLGVHPWERGIAQQISMDIKLYRHLQDCQDKLSNTICYASFAQGLRQEFAQHCDLLETVVAKTIDYALKNFELAAVEVVAKKFHMIENCDHVAVRMLRKA